MTYAHTAPSSRDRSWQAGFPLPAALAEAGYERGHLIAHASDGGLDANVFAQAVTSTRAGHAPRPLHVLPRLDITTEAATR